MELPCKIGLHWFGILTAFLPYLMFTSAQNINVMRDSLSPVFYNPKNTNPLQTQLQRIARQQETEECPEEQVSFEMVTGYVYTAPADMLDSQPGTLMLTDCIDTCRKNSSCRSINYETGLCVLFASNADDGEGELTTSQFPVFTIYVQKNCLPSAAVCTAAWSFERVMGHQLASNPITRARRESRNDCMELCLTEDKCRSAIWIEADNDCSLLDVDRHVLAGTTAFQPQQGIDYLERSCIVGEPRRLCIYDRVKGKILKTVDSVYQAIDSREDCEDLCNTAPFRCHSYDYNDTGDFVCRLSHHSAHTLTQIEEPYLAIEEATTYELSSCYNVSIDCHSADMVATIVTSTRFDGKIYAKGSPLTCVEDVEDSLNFNITFGYNDIECGVEREGPGIYSNEVVIQHHDSIVTSSDLGLSLTCEYNLANKTVANLVDLKLTGEITPSLYEELIVDSPNVLMRVADDQGQDTKTATVGDPLSLIFEILDPDSPYEIFVRDLIALDGATEAELTLIDDRGCPADPTIMSELKKSLSSDKILVSRFDAFRFPSSDMVQFRAMVTPCMPTCPPVTCDVLDYTGQSRQVESYGRKKRSALLEAAKDHHVVKRQADPSEVLVVQTLRIVDKNKKFNNPPPARLSDNSVPSHTVNNQTLRNNYHSNHNSYNVQETSMLPTHQKCVEENTLISGAVIFLVIQVIILSMFVFLWKKKRNNHAKQVITPPESTTDSLSYMYESGFTRRLQ